MTTYKCAATHEQVEWSDRDGRYCWICGGRGEPCWPTVGRASTYFVCSACGGGWSYEYDRRGCERSHSPEAAA